MSRRFWFRVRILGWILILFCFVLYTINIAIPFFPDYAISLAHGITGIFGTLLVLIGYYYLNELKIDKS